MGFTVRVTLVVEVEGASRDTRGRHGSELDRGTSATTCRGSCRVEEEHGITNLSMLVGCHFRTRASDGLSSKRTLPLRTGFTEKRSCITRLAAVCSVTLILNC